MRAIIVGMGMLILGCVTELDSTDNCDKVVMCMDDKESYCDPPEDGGCGRVVCYYFTFETCWESCKEDVEDVGV